METDQYEKRIIWFKGKFWVNASKEQESRCKKIYT